MNSKINSLEISNDIIDYQNENAKKNNKFLENMPQSSNIKLGIYEHESNESLS